MGERASSWAVVLVVVVCVLVEVEVLVLAKPWTTLAAMGTS